MGLKEPFLALLAGTLLDGFHHFDFPIAVIAFILLGYVVCSLLISINNTTNNVNQSPQTSKVVYNNLGSNRRKSKDRYNERILKNRHGERKLKNRSNFSNSQNNTRKRRRPYKQPDRNTTNINESINNIKFESNDLLDDYKK